LLRNTKKITEILREDVLQEDNTFIYDFGTTAFLKPAATVESFRERISPTPPIKLDQVQRRSAPGKETGQTGLRKLRAGLRKLPEIRGGHSGGPEYESIAVAGPNVGIDDPEAIVRFNQVADDMGLDTISAGDTIAWAMEMTKKEFTTSVSGSETRKNI
jgi:aldehyde:ferredoxin oxidoreductase